MASPNIDGHDTASFLNKMPAYQQPVYPEPAASQPHRQFTLGSLRPSWPRRHSSTEEALQKSKPISKRRAEWNSFLSRKWAVTFAAVTLVQAIICLSFEVYVYVKLESRLKLGIQNNVKKQVEIIPTFLPLFIFGFLYENVLVWDALRAKNTIQIMGACFANFALAIYTGIQIDQVYTALVLAKENNQLQKPIDPDKVFRVTKPYLFTICALISTSTIIMVFAAWKLYQEFSWSVLKIIGADYKMKKRFLCYQIYIGLLKFDFFFVIGFMIQLVSVVTSRSDPEFGLTIAAMPITLIILGAAAFCTRREIRWGMVITIILYLGALSYFIFKSARVLSNDSIWQEYYKAVRKPLAAFALITIVLIVITIINAIYCMHNFGKGLKDYFGKRSKNEPDQEMGSPGPVNEQHRMSRITIE
ncbi:unnamed protein product [Clonostachys byssicola]|uniref:Uncharacterized protein n=1 Tax=Clonostachys byssicola TaxID=160290 RepID=A0A9N9USR0_9HYPO|nr:unnamed protein product [Clonostachys byssicola]